MMWTYRALSVLVVLVLAASFARADLVSPYGGETAPNFVELIVLEDRVRVVLEIDRADFPYFVAPEDDAGTGLAARTGRTLRVEADGTPLEPVTRTVDLRPRKQRQTAATSFVAPRPRSAEVIYAELEFHFEGRPERIAFTPPLDKDSRPVASIGVLAQHMGVRVTDYRYLSQREIMRLDWDDPWFTRFDNPNLTRHHASPLMSFVSVEPREVRHELILRLADLESWVDLPLDGASEIGEAEMAIVTDAATEFLRARNPLSVDGIAQEPFELRISRIAVGVEGLRVLPEDAVTPRRTTLLGAILSYPQTSLADEVAMTWGLFPKTLSTIPVTLTDPAGGVPAQVRVDDATVVWTNHLTSWHEPVTKPVTLPRDSPLRLPLLSGAFALGGILLAATALRAPGKRRRLAAAAVALALAAAASPVTLGLRQPPSSVLNEESAGIVMSGLIENAGVAMLETRETAFETSLAPFVEDGQRDAVGREILRGLTVTLPSGARGRVEKIEDLVIEDIRPASEAGGQAVLAHWTATMTGGHWGHLHRRKVTYRALAEIVPQDGTWMLSGLTVLRAQ